MIDTKMNHMLPSSESNYNNASPKPAATLTQVVDVHSIVKTNIIGSCSGAPTVTQVLQDNTANLVRAEMRDFDRKNC